MVADIVYVPLETPLLMAARARGLIAVDGLGMLLHQAVPGFARWFGVRPQVTAELRDLIVARHRGRLMLIIGLTGSIGMGKSTVAARFRALGVPCATPMREVHKLYEGAAVAPIEAAFPAPPPAARSIARSWPRRCLRGPQDFKRLEAIVHPLVVEAERAFLSARPPRGAKMAVLEVPLLLETGGHAPRRRGGGGQRPGRGAARSACCNAPA